MEIEIERNIEREGKRGREREREREGGGWVGGGGGGGGGGVGGAGKTKQAPWSNGWSKASLNTSLTTTNEYHLMYQEPWLINSLRPSDAYVRQ